MIRKGFSRITILGTAHVSTEASETERKGFGIMQGLSGGAECPEEFLKLSGGLINAMNGLWFLAVEEALGNDEALRLNAKVWESYLHLFVRRIRKSVSLSGSTVEEIGQLIRLDPSFLVNDYEISHISRERMFLRVNRCPSLEAMEKAGRNRLICEATTGLYFRNLAKEVDPEIRVYAMKLPPRNSPPDACCEWLFETGEAVRPGRPVP